MLHAHFLQSFKKMKSSKASEKPWVAHNSGSFRGKMTPKESAPESNQVSTGISLGASQECGWVVDRRNPKDLGNLYNGQFAPKTSTPSVWGQPDQAQRLGLHRVNPTSTLQTDDKMGTDTEDEEDDTLYSDDDGHLSDDSDSSHMGYDISRHHKMLKKFFDLLDKLSVEEVNNPAKQYHCPACQGGPGAIDWYRGLQPLIMHAKTKGSRRVKLHRKFADLISEELQRRGIFLIASTEVCGHWEGPKQDVKDAQIVWPPMVIVMNTLIEKDIDSDKWAGIGNEELLLIFGDYGAIKARNSYGPQGHRGMSILVFESSAKGYIEAQRLDEHFLKQGRGRAAWQHGPVLFGPGGKRRLFGFMAVKEDLDLFNRHYNGKPSLKFSVRSYEEMVVKQIAQMSEDNELLIEFKKRTVTAEQLAKATEQSLNVTCQKLRRTLKDSSNVRETSKSILQQNKEQMDYLEQFVEERFREIHEAVSPMVSDIEKFHEETDKKKAKLFNSHNSTMLDCTHRMEEMTRFLELNTQDKEKLEAEKVELVKICQDKMNELERRYQEEKLEIDREFNAALDKLVKKYSNHGSEVPAARYI